ncbi:hypothetical protein AVEN_258422-1 [Araneus ventricosus]|uniref:Uncharacterized protein n=1 Tax=Araneus ventricosus TaxID=182803 RepID=A0A4Y2DIL9_ARAVE|nr:hypothetical protein AVEN_258422-1 [Araneus ventricosus]
MMGMGRWNPKGCQTRVKCFKVRRQKDEALIPILGVVIIYSKPSRGHIANCTRHHRRHHSRVCKISSSMMPRSNSGGETIARIIPLVDSNTEDVIIPLKDSVGGTTNRRNSLGEMMGSNMSGQSSSEGSLSQTQPYQNSSTSSVPGISAEIEINLVIPTEGPTIAQQMENSVPLEADSEEEPSLLIYLKDLEMITRLEMI